MLDKTGILGDAWPPAEAVISAIKMGGYVTHIQEAVETFIAGLLEKRHLTKYCWAVELCSERYESAGSQSRSPEDHADMSEAANPQLGQ